MVDVLIKYSTIISLSFYISLKLLHIRTTKKIILFFVIFLLITVTIVYFLRLYVPSFSIIIMIVLSTVFYIYLLKVPVNLVITTSAVSFGFSYIALFIATILGAPLYLCIRDIFYINLPFSVSLFFVSMIQVSIIMLSMKSKRLKNGMPHLIEHGSSDIGVNICVCILIAASFLGMNKIDDPAKLLPFSLLIISGLIVFFWWRNSITRKYFQKLKAQEIQTLLESINQKDAEIETLKQQNSELSKIIHRDNKIIPALEYAVRQYLLTAEFENDHALRLTKGNMLLAQIESISKERCGIIASYESNSRSLPSTGVASVDSLLLYLFQKAKEQQINFNLSLSGSVKYFIENIAAEQDVNTLLADLIENAMIASKFSVSKNILVHIGIVDSFYSLGIYDNGVPFTPETLSELGRKRTTTRAGEGGSGIGLMTTFDILRKYRASFVIEEYTDNSLYTKSVSVIYDELGQFRIKSEQFNRTDPITARDILFTTDIGA